MANFPFNFSVIDFGAKQDLIEYVNRGRPPSGFLIAVLENNLKEACGAADLENMRILPVYVAWLYNRAPSRCWGSLERIQEWCEVSGLQGLEGNYALIDNSAFDDFVGIG